MRKMSGCLGAMVAGLLLGAYLLFVRPVSPEIYFEYRSQTARYHGGEIEFYLVNDNPENGRDTYFFKVALELTPALHATCTLDDFDWELRRKGDGVLMYSTAQRTGQLDKSSYFANKIDLSVFKGLSGTGLGAHDFVVTLIFDADNGCGIGPNDLVMKKTMRLKRKKATAFDVMMSV